MAKILKSKAAVWGALVLVLLVIILTFQLRPAWWAFIDEFFMFMTVFCHLVAVYIEKFSNSAFKKLQMAAFISAVLMILSFVGEYIAYQVSTYEK